MTRSALLLLLVAPLLFGVCRAAESIKEAFREGDVLVDYRLRYESVEQEGFLESAEALTSRLRIGFQTAPYLKNTSLQLEAVWIEDVIDDYNSTTNGQTRFPVVADPADFVAVNRFALVSKALEQTTLTFGRQRIILDDSRFVGNVGWRQNEQTFDALRAQVGRPGFSVDLAYSDQVNRVFGPDSPVGEWHGDILLANASYALRFGDLTFFDYLVDLTDAAAVSSNTIGVRLSGAKAIADLSATYAFSYARQADAGRNPADYTEEYYLLEGGIRFPKFAIALGYELLGGDGANSFSTPLATLHVFQGWADKFLSTPASGMEDRYVRLNYPIGQLGPFTSLNALVSFHDFSADRGAAHFGGELDAQIVGRMDRVTLMLKYSDYRADQLLTDTDKLWLSVEYAF